MRCCLLALSSRCRCSSSHREWNMLTIELDSASKEVRKDPPVTSIQQIENPCAMDSGKSNSAPSERIEFALLRSLALLWIRTRRLPHGSIGSTSGCFRLREARRLSRLSAGIRHCIRVAFLTPRVWSGCVCDVGHAAPSTPPAR